MADTFVADISNYQDSADVPLYRQTNAKIISQVSWGTSVTSPNGRIAQIRSLNFAVTMWYMGLTSFNDIGSQVNTFSSQLGSLQAGEAVCIDWESTNGTMPSADQRDEAAGLIGQAFNIAENMVGVYSTPSFLANSPPPGWAWVAEYGQPEPAVSHVLWQFSNGVDTSPPYPASSFPGIGFCDGSVYHGTDGQLAAQICPTVPSPLPTPVPTPPKDEAMISSTVFNGHIYVAWVSLDGSGVWVESQSIPGSGWTPVELPTGVNLLAPQAPSLTVAPAAGLAPTTLHCFAVRQDGHQEHWWLPSTASAWQGPESA